MALNQFDSACPIRHGNFGKWWIRKDSWYRSPNFNYRCVENGIQSDYHHDSANNRPIGYGYTGCQVFKWGGTKLERFLPKNQHTQRKLLNFENWCSVELSKIGH